jgi:acetyltransferase-like isoleucine patch superfamily enzyme
MARSGFWGSFRRTGFFLLPGITMVIESVGPKWARFWMRFAGLSPLGRAATYLAALFWAPHKGAQALAMMNPRGFIAPTARVHHADVGLGANIFLSDRVLLYQAHNGGPITLGDRVAILRDSILETGEGGSITIGAETYIHPRCQLNAYLAAIEIGARVLIAANTAFYVHNHSILFGKPIMQQPLEYKGPIRVGDDAWLGTGAVVLGGVTIGEGAVIGAGSVVINGIPPYAVACGAPARVVKMRQ